MTKSIFQQRTNHSKLEHPSFEHEKQKRYYWIWFNKSDTHKGLWGPYNSYAEAERIAVSKLNVPYEVMELTTRDEGEASRRLRSRLLNETGDTEKSFNKFSHKQGD